MMTTTKCISRDVASHPLFCVQGAREEGPADVERANADAQVFCCVALLEHFVAAKWLSRRMGYNACSSCYCTSNLF